MRAKMLRLMISAGAALLASAPAQAETLKDALMLAYQTNPTIRAERARLRAVKEAKAQAWAGALPQVTAGGGYEKVDASQTTLFGCLVGNGACEPSSESYDYAPLTAQVDAEQPVFTGFRNYNAIKQAGARMRAGGAQLVSVEQQVLSDVAAAYFDVQLNMAVFDLNKSNVAVLTRQQEMAAARFEVGEITRTDVAQADARLAAARADLINAQGGLAVARAAYARLVGQMPGELEPVTDLPELPETLEAAHTLANDWAPPLVAAREQSEISRRQVNIERGALLPSVSLTARYQYADEPSTFVTQSEEYAYGVRASVPIFLGGLNYSRVREAKALHASDKSSVEEAQRQVEESVIAAWERLQVAEAVIRSAEAAVEANKLALRGVRQESELGARTTLDVLDAEQEMLNAEVTLVQARRDAQTAAYALLAATGMLTPEAVGIDSLAAGGEGDLLESMRR